MNDQQAQAQPFEGMPDPEQQREQHHKTLAIRVDEAVHTQLRFIAQLSGSTITDEIRRAIDTRIATAQDAPSSSPGHRACAMVNVRRQHEVPPSPASSERQRLPLPPSPPTTRHPRLGAPDEPGTPKERGATCLRSRASRPTPSALL